MRDEVLSRWFASYPEDVFLPLDAAQVGDAVKAIQATGITSDALYGGWARHILFHVMSEIKKADEELLVEDGAFVSGDRVTVTNPHPWGSYSGKVVGPWPGFEGGYLVALDNGINIRAEEGQLHGC